jgi:hypothetical protein
MPHTGAVIIVWAVFFLIKFMVFYLSYSYDTTLKNLVKCKKISPVILRYPEGSRYHN